MTEPTFYAHDAHCNTRHVAGPEECPPAREYDETEQEATLAERVAALEQRVRDLEIRQEREG